jgi:hypothetical protein
MTITISVSLLVLAFICFLLDTFGVKARVAWTPLGLALWVLSGLTGGR